MSETTKWLLGIIAALVLAWMAVVVDAMIDSTRLEGRVWEYERRLMVLESEVIQLRGRVRHLERGGVHALPEE